MASPNIITWNVANWITVALMAVITFVGIRLILDGIAKLGNRGDD